MGTLSIKRMRGVVAIAALVAGAAAGCSMKVPYDSAQGWQRLECQKIQDLSTREKCLKDASTSYDDYRRQSESAKAAK